MNTWTCVLTDLLEQTKTIDCAVTTGLSDQEIICVGGAQGGGREGDKHEMFEEKKILTKDSTLA